MIRKSVFVTKYSQLILLAYFYEKCQQKANNSTIFGKSNCYNFGEKSLNPLDEKDADKLVLGYVLVFIYVNLMLSKFNFVEQVKY